MADFTRNILNRTSDGTQEGAAGIIPPGWGGDDEPTVEFYTFTRRTHVLPDGIDGTRTFEATSYREALQMASDYWFNGSTVGDTLVDSNGVITLLEQGTATETAWGGNVIGTLMQR